MEYAITKAIALRAPLTLPLAMPFSPVLFLVPTQLDIQLSFWQSLVLSYHKKDNV